MTITLALDIGTTGTKAALVDENLRVLRATTREYATHSADGGVMEQKAADWWEAAGDACRELDPLEAGAVVVTGQMQDVILLDASGNPVRDVILYSDTRAKDEAARVVKMMGTRLFDLTGNHLGEGPDGLPAKLLWLQKHEPGALATAQHLLLGAASYVVYQMTGVPANDTTTSSATGLLDLSTRRTLGGDAFGDLSLHKALEKLPGTVSGGAEIGSLTSEAARSLGLKPGIPVCLGPGDVGATTLGAGSGEIGTAYAYLGTSGWVAFTAEGRTDPESGVITLAHPLAQRTIQVAPLLTAGGNLAWVRDLFNEDDFDMLIADATEYGVLPPVNLIYLPYLNGERSPFFDPLARGAFIGMDARTGQAQMVRAVLAGVAYGYRHALDALIDTPVMALTITGGGTRSETWLQLFADVLGIPVNIAGDAENVGVRGAVLAMQVASGQRETYAPGGVLPVSKQLQPNPAYRTHYDTQYAIYRDAYPALEEIFKRMGGG